MPFRTRERMKPRILQTSVVLFFLAVTLLTSWMLRAPLSRKTETGRNGPLMRALTLPPASVPWPRRTEAAEQKQESFNSVTMSFGNPEFGERNFAPAAVRGFQLGGTR